MRPIPPKAADFIKKHEALILRVYDDKRPKVHLLPGDPVEGVLTAGWGHTGNLHVGQEVTRALAQEWFDSDVLNKAIKPLYKRLGDAIIDELTDGQWGALISFVFNLGTGPTGAKEWEIWRLLKKRHFDQVPAQMMLFVNWAGKKSQGLVNRRTAEVDLWSEGEPGSQPEQPPSSVTRREATPPTPTDPVPPQKSATVLTGALGAAATVPVAVKAVSDAIEPYKDASPLVGNAFAMLATVAAAAVVAVLILTWLSKRRARA